MSKKHKRHVGLETRHGWADLMDNLAKAHPALAITGQSDFAATRSFFDKSTEAVQEGLIGFRHRYEFVNRSADTEQEFSVTNVEEIKRRLCLNPDNTKRVINLAG